VKTIVEGKALNVSETQEHNMGIFYFALKLTKIIKPEVTLLSVFTRGLQ
jgi:hypothetical protein